MAHPQSPWYQRINMLGEKRDTREYKGPTVSQAAWIRSLMASFVKQWEGMGTKIGGLLAHRQQPTSPYCPGTGPCRLPSSSRLELPYETVSAKRRRNGQNLCESPQDLGFEGKTTRRSMASIR